MNNFKKAFIYSSFFSLLFISLNSWAQENNVGHWGNREDSSRATYADDYWLDWKEQDMGAIPPFSIKDAIEVQIDPQSQVRWFIAPETISLSNDRVVRYVTFALSRTGTVNAFYEGILCAQHSYKTYARTIGQQNQTEFTWRLVENSDWKDTNDTQGYAHERILANRYMCDGRSMPSDVSFILKRLRNPYSTDIYNPAQY